MKYCGRAFTEEDITLIQPLIEDNPGINRLSSRFCEEVGWRKADGGLKAMSCRAALLQMHRDGHIRTGRNHAGENMTDLLQQRDPQIGPPVQMCDALSRNTSREFATLPGNCLAHARRNFVDVAANFPEKCSCVIETLAGIYKAAVATLQT